MPVFDKYILYSEALSQYHTLDKEDQKIIEPYIMRLKELWQEELILTKKKLNNLVPKEVRFITG